MIVEAVVSVSFLIIFFFQGFTDKITDSKTVYISINIVGQ